MKIAAHLGVKDEVDLIERAIVHLRAIGVDTIVVCDMCSTDGTFEVLERYRSNEFEIIQLSNRTPTKTWLLQNYELIKAVDADWILLLDADEFWLPSSGSLKDYVTAKLMDVDV